MSQNVIQQITGKKIVPADLINLGNYQDIDRLIFSKYEMMDVINLTYVYYIVIIWSTELKQTTN